MGPSVSRVTGKKSWVPLRELYFVVFLAAAVSDNFVESEKKFRDEEFLVQDGNSYMMHMHFYG